MLRPLRSETQTTQRPWQANEAHSSVKLYEALKPGTIILADVSLHCYIYPQKDPNEDGRKVNWLVHLIMTTLPNIYFPDLSNHRTQNSDIQQSDQAVEHWLIPQLPSGKTDDNENAKARKTDDLLATFTTKKKLRMDTE